VDRNGHADRGAVPDAHAARAHPYAVGDRDAHMDADGYTQRNADPDRDACADYAISDATGADGHAIGYRYAISDAAGTDADGYRNPHAHADGDGYCDPSAHANAHADGCRAAAVLSATGGAELPLPGWRHSDAVL